jgi:hypothetical protein
VYGISFHEIVDILKKTGLIILVYLLSGIVLSAQPANYWSVSFNSEASLLAGAVVGGNSDITSIYYNPAGIAEIENKKIALNANLFNLSYTNYKNALGTGLGLDYLGFTVQPRFISYIFKLKSAEKLVWQFAIFNRNTKRVSVYDQIEKQVQLLKPPNKENYTGNLDFVNDYLDSWGGFGIAYELNTNFTIGASLLFSIKDFAYMNLININIHPIVESLPDTVDYYTAYSDNYEKIVSYDVRALGKIGIRYQIDRLSLGLNISLPSVRLFGNSDVKRNISNAGILDGDEVVEDVYINESANYLKSGFKDPLSISLGFKYKDLSGRSSYYFTTEYFYKIDTYKAIDGTQVVSNEYEPGTDFLSYKFGAKSIVNFAVGWQMQASEKFELLFGFRTNFNPYSVSAEGEFSEIKEFIIPITNLYHLTGGSKFNYKKLSVIAGLEFVTGRTKGLTEFVNFSEPAIRPGNNLALSGIKNNNMTYINNIVGLYFGFTLGF